MPQVSVDRLLSKRIAALSRLARDGYDSSARLALRCDSGAINRHLRLDATPGGFA